MGSWNKTCGLSNLHITSGTPVYVFVLEPNEHHDRCYSTALFKPLMLPFESVYDDYGGGENSGGVGFNYIMEAIEKNLVEKEVGANQYHDIAVKRENFSEEIFFSAVHENRLEVGHMGRETPLDYVMFRKDIVDDILENYEIEKYVGGGHGTGGWGNNYIYYKFADIVASIPKVIELLLGENDEVNEILNSLPEDKRQVFKIRMRGFRNLQSSDDGTCLAASWLQGDNYRNSRLVDVQDVVAEMLEEGDTSELIPLLTDHLKAKFIDGFMHDTRKLWVPGCHEGSQNSDRGPYRFLCKAITKVLDAEAAEYAEECDDDQPVEA